MNHGNDESVFLRPSLKFERCANSAAEFIIKPENNSDYLIKADTDVRYSVEVGDRFKNYTPVEKGEMFKTVGSVCNLILNEGVEYRITIESPITSGYTVEIQQNNWVYAPKGGVFYNPKFTNKTWYDNDGVDYIDYTKMYLTDNTLALLIETWTSDGILSQRHTDSTGKKNYEMALHDHIPKLFYTTEEILGINSLTGADVANIIANVATYTGVVLMVFPELSVTAGIVILVGTGSTTSAIQGVRGYIETFNEKESIY